MRSAFSNNPEILQPLEFLNSVSLNGDLVLFREGILDRDICECARAVTVPVLFRLNYPDVV